MSNYGGNDYIINKTIYALDCQLIIKLGIEIDGASHIGEEEYDKLRTQYINEFGIKIIRYKNDDILYNLDWVIQDILKYY